MFLINLKLKVLKEKLTSKLSIGWHLQLGDNKLKNINVCLSLNNNSYFLTFPFLIKNVNHKYFMDWLMKTIFKS